MRKIKKVNEVKPPRQMPKWLFNTCRVLLFPIVCIVSIPDVIEDMHIHWKHKRGMKVASNDKKIEDILFHYFYKQARWQMKYFGWYSREFRETSDFTNDYGSHCRLLTDCIYYGSDSDFGKYINQHLLERPEVRSDFQGYSHQRLVAIIPRLEEAGLTVTPLQEEKGYLVTAERAKNEK